MKKDITWTIIFVALAISVNGIMDWLGFKMGNYGDSWHFWKKVMQLFYCLMGIFIFRLGYYHGNELYMRFKSKHLIVGWIVIFSLLTLAFHEFVYHGILK